MRTIIGWPTVLVLLLPALGGCFVEKTFVLNPDGADSTALSVVSADSEGESTVGSGSGDAAADQMGATPAPVRKAITVREWLRETHEELSPLLPREEPKALLTEDLAVGGEPADVFGHFGLPKDQLQHLLRNFEGLENTAQAASTTPHIDTPAPAWPGFEDVWIPMNAEVSLSGRLGFAHDATGEIRRADCIVVMPGLFGDNGVKRSRDLAVYLVECGFHVLSLEIRAHGQTEAKYPGAYCSFGVMSSDDLLKVSDWLEAMPEVDRTGLVGFCWSANIALLVGWMDGRGPEEADISPYWAARLAPPTARRRYAAGIIAFSAVVDWEVLVDALETPRSKLREPAYAAIQATVRNRMERKGYPDPDGSLRRLIELEYESSGGKDPTAVPTGYRFLRLIPYAGRPVADKLECVRTPLLIVHGFNDPLAPADAIAKLAARTNNPNVAALVLPGGGHVGFAPYARDYYARLVALFFDPKVGAAAEAGLRDGGTVRPD